MAGELSIPANVLVVKAVVRKLTRFVVDYAGYDATTEFTAKDQNVLDADRYRFKVVAANPIAAMPGKLLITMRTTRMPSGGRTFPTANLHIVAKTATLPEATAVVLALVLNKQHATVEMSRLEPRQRLSRIESENSQLTLPVRCAPNHVTARVSATHGAWDVVTATQTATDLVLTLKCVSEKFRAFLDPAEYDRPFTNETGAVTVTMTSEDDEEEELPPAEVVFVTA